MNIPGKRTRRRALIAYPRTCIVALCALIIILVVLLRVPNLFFGSGSSSEEECPPKLDIAKLVSFQGRVKPSSQGQNSDRFPSVPSSVNHGFNDEDLLWRASMVPVREYPYRLAKPGKVAFLFHVEDRLHTAVLWELFWARHVGRYTVYVHAKDPDALKEWALPPSFRGRVIRGQRNEGNDFVSAQRRLVGNALLDLDNERFVFISGTSIPLYNFTFMYDYLMLSPHSFVQGQGTEGGNERQRYNGSCFEPEVTAQQWLKGSANFALTRGLAVLLVSDTRLFLKFQECCWREECVAREHYAATVLYMLADKQIANWPVAFADWWTTPGQLYSYKKEEVRHDLLASMRKCNGGVECPLFGQQFKEETMELLLIIGSDFIF